MLTMQYACAQSGNRKPAKQQQTASAVNSKYQAAVDAVDENNQWIKSDRLYANASSFAAAGKPALALQALNEAFDAGFSDINRLKDDKDLLGQLGEAESKKAIEKLRNNMAPYISGKAILTEEEKKTILQLAQRGLKRHYFDESKAAEMIYELGQMFDSGAFKGKDDVAALTGEITNYLRKKTNDKHFYIGVNHSMVSERVPNLNVTTPAERNYGFREVSVRPGNIGYLRWDECSAGDEAYRTAFNALGMLRNARAIVIDISGNGGGNGEISTFLYHYLFKQDDKSFETLLIKKCKGEPDWHRSEPPVAPLPGGPDLGDKPIYVVTSGNTFSAAEYFAFMMKELGRATIIGKNTGGGGNPVNIITNERYIFFVPTCQITTKDGKSLEGKGVAPDIEFKTSDFAKEIMEVVNADLKAKGK